MPFRTKEEKAAWRAKNRERINAYRRKWESENPDRQSAYRQKAAEKRAWERVGERFRFVGRFQLHSGRQSLGYSPRCRRVSRPEWGDVLRRMARVMENRDRRSKMTEHARMAHNVARLLALMGERLARQSRTVGRRFCSWEVAAHRCVKQLAGGLRRLKAAGWGYRAAMLAKSCSSRRKDGHG